MQHAVLLLLAHLAERHGAPPDAKQGTDAKGRSQTTATQAAGEAVKLLGKLMHLHWHGGASH